MMTLPLPPVLSATECAQFGSGFAPYVFSSQLTSLPSRVLEAGANLDNLKEIYASTNPFVTVLAFALVLSPVFVILSEINRNYSQVDRVWSILPAVYNAHYAIWARMAGLPTSRLDSVALFTLFWGVRPNILSFLSFSSPPHKENPDDGPRRLTTYRSG